MSALRLAFGIGLCLAVGYLLTDILLMQIRTRTWLKPLFGVGLGVGLSSLTYFTWRLLPAVNEMVLFVVELTLAAGLGLAWFLAKRRGKQTAVFISPANQARLPAGWSWALNISLTLASLSAILNYIFATLIKPHGGWDAWSIWNLAARFLFSSNDDWKHLFDPAIFHPDYPLLLGSTVARLWTYLGVKDLVAPAIVGFLFSVAIFGLLITLANLTRGGASGILAGLALLGSSALWIIAPTQSADILISYYFLGALGCLSLYQKYPKPGFLFLSGILLGLGVWTKNEGWLLAAAVLLGWIVTLLFFDYKPYLVKDRLRKTSWLLIGFIPVIVIPLIHKWFLAPPNDLVALQNGETLFRITDPARWIVIGQRFMISLVYIGGDNWVPLGLLLVLVIIFGIRKNAFSRSEIWINLTALMTALSGYFLVFLVSPHDLSWHLRTSLQRLFAQLWPAAVFTMALIIRLPGDSQIEEPKTH